MANEPRYRDLSGNPYLEYFDEITVERIEKVALAGAAVLFLFGIFYFSLAPAAFLETLEISKEEIPGFSCRMTSPITRIVDLFSQRDKQEIGLVSTVALSSFKASVKSLGDSGIFFTSNFPTSTLISIDVLTSDSEITKMLRSQSIKIESLQFETHSDCMKSTTRSPVCEWSSAPYTGFVFDGRIYNRDAQPLCVFIPSCSSFNGQAKFIPFVPKESPIPAIIVNFSATADPSIGRCSNQFNKSDCSSGIEHCESIRSYQKAFQSAMQNFILTPEVLCHPFLRNPPYLCTRRGPQTIPSILSQSAALASSALVFFKLAMFFIVKKNFFRKPKSEQITELTSVVSNETRIIEGGSVTSHELL
jgi:hypothetical protein